MRERFMKLETERLILRDFVKDDWRAVLEYQSDPLYLRYYDWTARTPEAGRNLLAGFWIIKGRSRALNFNWRLR